MMHICIVSDKFVLFAPGFVFLTPKVFSVVSVAEKLAFSASGGAGSNISAIPRPKASGFPQQQKLLAKNEQSQKEQIYH